MIVSDQSLKKLLAEGTIVVEPLEERQIQPASIDLRVVPELSFVLDDSSENYLRIAEVLKRIHEEDEERDEQELPGDAGEPGD